MTTTEDTMTTTYRACYYTTPDGQGETVLTRPEHTGVLTDDELRNEAIAEAYRAGIVGDDESRLTIKQLRAGLTIGDWTA